MFLRSQQKLTADLYVSCVRLKVWTCPHLFDGWGGGSQTVSFVPLQRQVTSLPGKSSPLQTGPPPGSPRGPPRRVPAPPVPARPCPSLPTVPLARPLSICPPSFKKRSNKTADLNFLKLQGTETLGEKVRITADIDGVV